MSLQFDCVMLFDGCVLRARILVVILMLVCYCAGSDDCGVTPLLAAALNDHLQTCVVLIRDNCLLDVVGDVKLSATVQRQLTAVHGAIERHHFTVARLLLAAGASCGNNSSVQPPQHLLTDEDGCL